MGLILYIYKKTKTTKKEISTNLLSKSKNTYPASNIKQEILFPELQDNKYVGFFVHRMFLLQFEVRRSYETSKIHEDGSLSVSSWVRN